MTADPALAKLLTLWPRLSDDARQPSGDLAVPEQENPAEKSILERVENIIELEKVRAEGVMNDSRDSDNLRGYSYDCGYWEGLVYALSTINALIV